MYNSKAILSPQNGLHPHLTRVIEKHIHTTYRKPFQQHNLEAFDTLIREVRKKDRPKLHLDSCCGTGLSTRKLATMCPDTLVIGIDRSLKRLNTDSDMLGPLPDNCLLLRANCEDIWRLSVREGLLFTRHTILYPNPYPKLEHLKRRWHGHPVFPELIKLAQETELRSNWRTYLDECKAAWKLLKQSSSEVSEIQIDEPLTLFERKYAGSGQTLYELRLFTN